MHELMVLVVIRLWSNIALTTSAETAFCVLNCNVKYSSNSLLLCAHIKRRLHAPLLWAIRDTRAEITEVSINEEANERVDERTHLLAHAKMFKEIKGSRTHRRRTKEVALLVT